jgi:1-acyl-sn-glycerol-3-phosphate acyltransferase
MVPHSSWVCSAVVIRSIVFNALFYVNLIVQMLAVIPTMVMPRGAIVAVVKFWARTNLWLLRSVCGIAVEFRGLEKVPPGALIVASKHQSMWETFALFPLFGDPAFILKRELMWIPFFGWFSWKAGMIPVNRGKRSQALLDLAASVRQELARGRQIVIFPEGTRRAPGAEPNYKFGVTHLYVETGAVCLPIALNSGLFWPRRTFMRYPGTLVVEFLDPLPPGLPRDEFLIRMRTAIEDATNRIVADAQAEQAQLFSRVPASADRA